MDKRTLEICAMYMTLRYPYEWQYAQKVICKYIFGLEGEGAEELEKVVWC